MFNIKRISRETKPNKVEYLGNNNYYYNYDIQESIILNNKLEDIKVWSFILVRIVGKPNYSKCVKALIRAYIDENSEFDLINSYNTYWLGLDIVDNTYKDYLQLIKTIKLNVRKDFNHDSKIMEENISDITFPDIIRFINTSINLLPLTEELSISFKSLYPNWETLYGEVAKENFKFKYNNRLYKVITEHTIQENLIPNIETSLYEEIGKSNTLIQNELTIIQDYNPPMILEKDKFYKENDIVYKCTQNSKIAISNKLSDLVGYYVTIV